MGIGKGKLLACCRATSSSKTLIWDRKLASASSNIVCDEKLGCMRGRLIKNDRTYRCRTNASSVLLFEQLILRLDELQKHEFSPS
jgi:hypothetical protein